MKFVMIMHLVVDADFLSQVGQRPFWGCLLLDIWGKVQPVLKPHFSIYLKISYCTLISYSYASLIITEKYTTISRTSNLQWMNINQNILHILGSTSAARIMNLKLFSLQIIFFLIFCKCRPLHLPSSTKKRAYQIVY